MEVQQYEEALLAEIRRLPPEHVREGLDFAAFLRGVGAPQGLWHTRSPRPAIH